MEEIAKRRFDIETFDKNKRKQFRYITSDSDQIYEFTDGAGVFHEQVYSDSLYYEKIIYPDSLIFDAYVFYPNGSIKIFNRALIKGTVEVGNKLHFDEQGNVIEIINHDEPYKFTLDQVLDYMKKNDIDIWDENVSLARGVGTENEPFPGVHTWLITIKIKPDSDLNEYIRKKIPVPPFKKRSIELDAVTGEVVWDKTVVLENY